MDVTDSSGSEPAGVVSPATPSPVRRAALPDAAACPSGPDATYLVTYDDPESPVPHRPPGWTLHAGVADTPWWSAGLAAHGAGFLAGPRQAQAVVVRALADRGVTVEGWDTDTSSPWPAYRARVAAASR